MKVEIKSANIIDMLVSDLDDYGAYTQGRAVGKTYEEKQANLRNLERNQRAAYKAMSAVADTLGCSLGDVLSVAHIARRWNEKTKWQRIMPESMADALLAGAIAGLLREQEKPREPGYYSAWAERRRAHRQQQCA